MQEMQEALDTALSKNIDIDDPLLSKSLLGTISPTHSLCCEIAKSATRHLAFAQFAQLLHLAAVRGARLDEPAAGEDPLEHLLSAADPNEFIDDLSMKIKLLLEMGCSLLDLVDRKGLDWLRSKLEMNALDELSESLVDQYETLARRRDLDVSTPRATRIGTARL